MHMHVHVYKVQKCHLELTHAVGQLFLLVLSAQYIVVFIESVSELLNSWVLW